MNWEMAKEVGPVAYIVRRILWRLLRKRGKPIAFRLPDGAIVKLPLDSTFASDIYCTRGYVDWGAEQLLIQYLQARPMAVCIDVGANMGYYSCLLSPYATEVIAFEPDPRNHTALQSQNIPNLTLIAKAVADTVGHASFDVSSASTVGHLHADPSATAQIQVETTTLDVCAANRAVSAIKMDVEGFEILCLCGAVALIQASQPIILIEFGLGDGLPNSIPSLSDFLSQHRYQIFAMIRHPAGARKFRTVLEKISADQLPTLNFKMLFLVPAADTFFAAQCERGFFFEAMHRHG